MNADKSSATKKADAMRVQLDELHSAAKEARREKNIAAEVVARAKIVELSGRLIDLEGMDGARQLGKLDRVREQRRRAEEAGSHVAAKDLLRQELMLEREEAAEAAAAKAAAEAAAPKIGDGMTGHALVDELVSLMVELPPETRAMIRDALR